VPAFTYLTREAAAAQDAGQTMSRLNLVFASGFLFPQRFLKQDYFRDVRTAFPGACFPRVPVTGSIDARAQALAAAIGTFRFPDPTAPIHIIGHSMGGLDARYALHRNISGVAARVASLSTIGTPHRGSPIADLLVPGGRQLRRRVYRAVRRATGSLGLRTGALGNLTTGYARQFNQEHPDIGNIPCFCYAGNRTETYLLRVAGVYIRNVGQTPAERESDGLVSVASASWKPLAEAPWSTDHLGQVGHTLTPPRFASRFPHLEALRRVIERASAAASSSAR
jgi:triacylglycerol lipase